LAKNLRTGSPLAARTRQTIQVEDLTGGIDLRRSPTLVDPARAQRLKNWTIGEPGALTVEPGYTQVSAAAFGSTRAQGGARVYVGGTAFTLMAYDGQVFRPTDAWVRGAAVYSTVSSVNNVFFPYDRDLVMVLDGSNRPRFSTNGTNWFLSGTDAPSSKATLSTLSTGGLSSGEFEVAYSYKHRGTAHESNISSGSTITITASSGAIAATASPSTDPKVDAIVWYAKHKLPDGETVFRKVSSGAASTTTITSSAWTAATEAPTNHDVPPSSLKFGVSWKSRWWAAFNNRLHFTELFQPQSWPALFFIDIPFTKGDSITAILPLGDTLIVRGQSGAYLVIGQTSLDFEVRPSQAAEGGAFGPRASVAVSQAEVHISADGVDRFDGAADGSLEDDIQVAWLDMTKNSASTSLDNVAAIYDPLSQTIRIAVPRVFPTGARGEWILNLDRTRDNSGVPAWTTTDRDVAFYMRWDGNEPTAGNRGRMFFVPNSTVGQVYEILDRTSENAATNSSNVTAEYRGSALSLGLHRARVLDLHVEYEPHGGAASAETVIDGVSMGSVPLTIGSGLYTYGAASATYGTALYGGASRKKAYTTLPLNAEGRTIVLNLTYTGSERFKVFGYTYTILPEPSPRQAGE